MNTISHRKSVSFLSGLLVFCAGGCQSLYDNHGVGTLDQAGSTHMAVLSVAPWKKYRDSIQPQFTLTADGALQQVLANTVDYEQKILDAFAIRLKAGLPSSATSATTTTHQETGKAQSVTSDITKTVTPGDISKIAFSNPPTTAGASGLPGSAASTPISFDGMLRYETASAL